MSSMRSSNLKKHLVQSLLLILILLFGWNCYEAEPKPSKSGNIFAFWLISYLSDPPHRRCSNHLTGKEKALEQGVIIKGGDASYINDYYIINSPTKQPIKVKIELKSNCQVYRSFHYCLNNRYGYGSKDLESENYGTSCNDNSTNSNIPIQGDVGTSETCQLSYSAEAYYIHIYNYITTKDCYYEISYDY